ncbi:hypothetical protein F5Y09DRAFT_347267 [Xylaria sp. FL1042]|nr:hypothetical protein F5Y09DRAFT_347267 [Xylaria sp. FL1042]
MAFTASDICKIIFAIILPPLGVFLERGCGADFLINILLTILGYIPGIIHALYVQFISPFYPIFIALFPSDPYLYPTRKLRVKATTGSHG